MKEKVIFSNINDRELLESLAINGQGNFNVRFFNTNNFAKEALLRSGKIVIQKEISSIKQECAIYDIIKNVNYFKDSNFEDAKNINNAITYARKLCRGDEDTKIEEVFKDGEFKEKNVAILEVYKLYKQYLVNNNLTDSIEIINKAIKEAGSIFDEITVFEETPLDPLEKKLAASVSKKSKKQKIREFADRQDKRLSNITYANAYGSVNEVEYILGYIANNNIPYEDCVVTLIDNSYINQFISYRDAYKIPMSFGTGISLSFTNAYKVLTLLDRWNKGYNGYDALSSLINAPEFDSNKLWLGIDPNSTFTTRNKNDILKAIGNMRISVDSDNKLENYKSVLTNKKEIERLNDVEYIINELHKGYSYLIKTYTKNITGELEQKAIDTICSYLDEYFANASDGTLVDAITNLSNKMISRELSKPSTIHITNLEGALSTIRKHLFICGLNAKSFPGSPSENYLLLDSDLERFNESNVKNSTNKVNLNKKLLNDVLDNASAFDENIHLSYSGYSLSDLKVENPSSLLFEIFKKEHGPESTTKEFEDAVGEQHKYFDEAITNLKNVGAKYLDGYTTKPLNNKPDEYKNVLLEKTISPSNAGIFFDCPKHFYLTQVLGIYEPQEDDPFNALPANDEGTLIHECMEDYGNNPTWTKQEFMANAENKLNDYFKKRIPIHTKNIDTLKRNYLAMAEYGYDNDCHNEVYKSEYWLSFKDPNTGITFGGRVDRIEKLPNEKYQIVDYKTGRNIEHEEDNLDKCFQVILYAYLLENSEQKEVEKCEYRYLRLGKQIPCVNNDAIKAQLQEKLMEIKNAIDTGDFPCAIDEEACKYCKLGNICGKNKVIEDKEAQDE